MVNRKTIRGAITVVKFILITARTQAWWQINGYLQGSISKVQAAFQLSVTLWAGCPCAVHNLNDCPDCSYKGQGVARERSSLSTWFQALRESRHAPHTMRKE